MEFRELLERVNEHGRRHVITLHRCDDEIPVDVRHIASLTPSELALVVELPRRGMPKCDIGRCIRRGTDITMRYGDVVSVDEPVEEVTRQISMAEFAIGVDD